MRKLVFAIVLFLSHSLLFSISLPVFETQTIDYARTLFQFYIELEKAALTEEAALHTAWTKKLSEVNSNPYSETAQREIEKITYLFKTGSKHLSNYDKVLIEDFIYEGKRFFSYEEMVLIDRRLRSMGFR
jgi:hypothetical protein